MDSCVASVDGKPGQKISDAPHLVLFHSSQRITTGAILSCQHCHHSQQGAQSKASTPRQGSAPRGTKQQQWPGHEHPRGCASTPKGLETQDWELPQPPGQTSPPSAASTPSPAAPQHTEQPQQLSQSSELPLTTPGDEHRHLPFQNTSRKDSCQECNYSEMTALV